MPTIGIKLSKPSILKLGVFNAYSLLKLLLKNLKIKTNQINNINEDMGSVSLTNLNGYKTSLINDSCLIKGSKSSLSLQY